MQKLTDIAKQVIKEELDRRDNQQKFEKLTTDLDLELDNLIEYFESELNSGTRK
jgi:hypothetical protein